MLLPLAMVGLLVADGAVVRVPVVDTCAWSAECRAQGRCTTRGDRCIATSGYDCRASDVCFENRRCILNTEEGECDDGTERASTSMFVSGIVVATQGMATAVSGAGVYFVAMHGGALATTEQLVGIVMMASGGLLTLTVGVPLWVRGRCRVPRLQLQPGGAALVGEF